VAPLAGIRVLDLSRLLPGPYATLVLADLGADVVKVEDTGMGDYLRLLPPAVPGTRMGAAYVALNRGKRSIALDLKRPEGREAFLRLAAKADVVVESFRPGVMDRLGVGWGTLVARNPGIVLCSISGYGQSGPYRDRAGHDLNYAAIAGVLGLSGAGPGAAPHPLAVQLADIAGGGLWSAIGILAALAGRAASGGAGRWLDVSMTDGAASFIGHELAVATVTGKAIARGAELLTGASPTYRVYETADGKFLSVGALEPKFWGTLCLAIERPDLAEHANAQGEERERVAAELGAVLKKRTRDAWVERLAGLDVCVEPVLASDEVAAHPVNAARGSFVDMEAGGAGDLRVLATPAARIAGVEPVRGGAPAQGEHTRAVLRAAGLEDAEIDSMLAVGAAAQP
jgi:crotonobetainyl-CoA:carnitine CoA-transferase CaiB-like acyl-CoA transferase